MCSRPAEKSRFREGDGGRCAACPGRDAAHGDDPCEAGVWRAEDGGEGKVCVWWDWNRFVGRRSEPGCGRVRQEKGAARVYGDYVEVRLREDTVSR